MWPALGHFTRRHCEKDEVGAGIKPMGVFNVFFKNLTIVGIQSYIDYISFRCTFNAFF